MSFSYCCKCTNFQFNINYESIASLTAEFISISQVLKWAPQEVSYTHCKYLQLHGGTAHIYSPKNKGMKTPVPFLLIYCHLRNAMGSSYAFTVRVVLG